MKEKRRDNKGRILHTGESQRTDGKYLYKYVDAFGNTKYVYAWRLTPTDPTPKGKREKTSLRELEQQIRRDIEDGIEMCIRDRLSSAVYGIKEGGINSILTAKAFFNFYAILQAALQRKRNSRSTMCEQKCSGMGIDHIQRSIAYKVLLTA